MAQTAQELADRVAADITSGRLAPGAAVPSVRRLADEAGCAPGTAAKAHALLRRRGLLTGAPRESARVAIRPLRLAGSDDPALDLVLRTAGAAVVVVPGERGSVHGLTALARGTADAATVHLAHPASGGHNDAWGRGRVLVHLWTRQQGLVVAPGSPIRTVADLAGRHVAQRPPGSATRLLLERLLHEAAVEPAGTVPADTHLAVATAVSTGAADAGLAVRQAADAVGADWWPVVTEPFELLLDEAALPLAAPLLAAVEAVRDRLDACDLTRLGELRHP